MGTLLQFLKNYLDLFLHLDQHLSLALSQYGAWTYAILFAIIFCETGLVVAPFLPGDSLLFAVGALSASSSLSLKAAFLFLSVAAILGDTVNYWVGRTIGPRIFYKENVRFLNKKHLERTHLFYEKYGGKTIIIARFIPIVRTFAPFVAGIGAMTYFKFIVYNIVGGVLWIAVCLFSGYFFGNLPFVKQHFSLVILAVIFISVLPILLEVIKAKLNKI